MKEVFIGGITMQQGLKSALDLWLREQVASAYDLIKADPSRTLSTDKVRASLAAAHQALLQVTPRIGHID
jgi:hypothetical protein